MRIKNSLEAWFACAVGFGLAAWMDGDWARFVPDLIIAASSIITLRVIDGAGS